MNTASNIIAKKHLIDVIARSQRYCEFPIQGKLAYACKENFVGRVIDGDYFANIIDVSEFLN
jgi:hypothetical protein